MDDQRKSVCSCLRTTMTTGKRFSQSKQCAGAYQGHFDGKRDSRHHFSTQVQIFFNILTFSVLCLCTRTTTRKRFSQYYVVRARVWIGVIFGGKHDSRSLFLRWVETVVEAFKLSNVNIFITLQSGESLSAINKKIIIALTFLVQ